MTLGLKNMHVADKVAYVLSFSFENYFANSGVIITGHIFHWSYHLLQFYQSLVTRHMNYNLGLDLPSFKNEFWNPQQLSAALRFGWNFQSSTSWIHWMPLHIYADDDNLNKLTARDCNQCLTFISQRPFIFCVLEKKPYIIHQIDRSVTELAQKTKLHRNS